MIRKSSLVAVALLALISPSTVVGEALLCSLASIQVCTADGCEWRTAEDLHLPSFVIFDLEVSAILAVGEGSRGEFDMDVIYHGPQDGIFFQF